MANKTLLESAKKYRDLILLLEMAGWLHDLGKLSEGFIRHAAGTPGDNHKDIFNEVSTDPLHVHLARPFTGAGGWLPGPGVRLLNSDDHKILSLVVGHHGLAYPDLQQDPLLKHFVHADHEESGEDGSLASGIQADADNVQVATVFGKESLLVDKIGDLDTKRKQAYVHLQEQLDAANKSECFADVRDPLWASLAPLLDCGLGKTQRAVNDIRLDFHVWGVATRFKAYALQEALRQEQHAVDDGYFFRLLSIWWNSWEIITPFARLADALGREEMLSQLRDRLRFELEVEYALGNSIYEDANGIHFLVAGADWQPEIEPLMRGVVNEVSGGEVQPVIVVSEATRRVTDLAAQIQRAGRTVPRVESNARSGETAQTAMVCPNCRKRTLEADEEICRECRKWRNLGYESGRKTRSELGGTPWQGELADDHGRIALIVARFDLEHWLDGRMLHTMFATRPQDLHQDVGDLNVSSWTDVRDVLVRIPEENLIKREGQDQKARNDQLRGWGRSQRNTQEGKIAQKITSSFNQLDQIIDIISALPDFNGFPPGFPDKFLLALARKPPTAGRLLRVWNVCQDFLQHRVLDLKGTINQRNRLSIKVQTSLADGFYQVDLPGFGPMEMFLSPGSKFLESTEYLSESASEKIRMDKMQALVLTSASAQGGAATPVQVISHNWQSYIPVRPALKSPNLLLVFLPADQALEVAEDWRQKYEEEFGKVLGRLPFHIGVIYMDQHYPAFAAFDAARRLSETFDELAERPVEAVVDEVEAKNGVRNFMLHDKEGRFGAWQWSFPTQLGGGGGDDTYHPYVLVKEGDGLNERTMAVEGPGGRWVHVSEVQPNDTISFWPGFFDYLFLDTVTRRMDALLVGETDRRPHDLLKEHAPRPYLLERLPKMIELWKQIKSVPEMSPSRLQASTALLAGKLKSWGLKSDEYRQLAEWVVNRDFAGNGLIRTAVEDGSFFDCVELYIHILKQDLQDAVETPEQTLVET